jgi:glycosyltransferase involved in cell wall biosynthesis
MSRAPDILYLANARIPSEKAHVYQILKMCEAWNALGYQVELAYPGRQNTARMAQVSDLAGYYGLGPAFCRTRLVRLPSLDLIKLLTLDLPQLNRTPLVQAAFYLQSVTFALACAWYLRRSRAGIVYTRDLAVLGLTRLLGRARKRWYLELHDAPRGAARLAWRLVMPRLAGIICITEGLARWCRAHGAHGIPLIVAPDAVDPALLAAAPARAEARRLLGLPQDRPVACYTGHLYRWKGVYTLADAARLLPPEWLVCIVGGVGEHLDALRRYVAARSGGAEVRLPGYVPPAQVPIWLAAADVLVLPNSAQDPISREYTSPLKLFEYMAAGRPIVASDLPSLREVLEHGRNAWLVAPDDPAALAGALCTVRDDPALAGRLAERAHADVAAYTWEARARRLAAWLFHRKSESR